MVLYVKSDIDPVYIKDKWLWFANGDLESPFSFRGCKFDIDLFGKQEAKEKKIKFKFIKNKTGLLIDFCDSLADFSIYRLYIGNKLYCEFDCRRHFDKYVKNIFCDYYVLRFSLDNRFLRFHTHGVYDSTNTTQLFLGVADIEKESLLAIPFKTNLSIDGNKRFFFSLLNCEISKEEKIKVNIMGSEILLPEKDIINFYPTTAIKIKNDYQEKNFAREIKFVYFSVSVTIDSYFKNKRAKLKLL
jgi:hypothetical protein